jgi:hypothetical protein
MLAASLVARADPDLMASGDELSSDLEAKPRFAPVMSVVVMSCSSCQPSSQPDDQVADLGGLGEEWVVAGVEFHDAGCSTGELALQVGRGAWSCAQTRYVEGTCCQAADCTGCSSTARLCRAVLSMACRWISGSQSCRNVSARASGRTVNVPPSGSMSRNGRAPPAERGEALPDLGQVARHEQQMAHAIDARAASAVTMPP